MFCLFISRALKIPACALLLVVFICHPGAAQTVDVANGETDPVKLFEQGQDAHAKNDFKKAIELYNAAIKIKPEFPEAEFQRAMALLAINKRTEALEGFNRAVALRPDWAMAYSRFGSFLGGYGNDAAAAEPILRKALELDPKDDLAMVALAEIRARAGDTVEALKLIRTATSQPTAQSAVWRKRASIEIAAGDQRAALKSLDQALTIDPEDYGARNDRAKLRLDVGDRDGALADIRVLIEARFVGCDLPSSFGYAQLLARAGKRDEALRVLDALSEKDREAPEVIALRAEIAGGDGSTPDGRAALEEVLKRDPHNANLLSRLGSAYRLVDPLKSADYYYQALQIEPKNSEYAVGYAAALVQSHKFAEAETILRRVLASSPDDYTAHANLAIALYKLKRFAEAIPEYDWLLNKRPEIAATYFFKATAHDNLGEYPDALDAYQKFLSHADATKDKLEIEKVNLRLPTLRNQIQRGQGVKRKAPR